MEEQKEYVDKTFEEAKRYVFGIKHQWSIVPTVIGTKKPIVKWKPLTERFPTMNELKCWFQDYENPRSIAVVTGRLSKLVILDLDKGHKTDGLNLKPTRIARTGNGFHYFYTLDRYDPTPKQGHIKKGGVEKVEIQVNHLVTLPPSYHKNGNQYCWDIGNPNYEFAGIQRVPGWILKYRPKKIVKEFKKREPYKPSSEDSITQEDIDRAKSYPLQQLLDTHETIIRCPNPEHEDKNPSFSINVSENYGHCFSCNYNCDSIKYVQDKLGLDFVSAVRRLL